MKNQDDSKETKLRKIEICTDRALKKSRQQENNRSVEKQTTIFYTKNNCNL